LTIGSLGKSGGGDSTLFLTEKGVVMFVIARVLSLGVIILQLKRDFWRKYSGPNI